MLVDHAHGELDPAAAREVAEHLGHCGECATAYCRLQSDLGGIVSAHVETPRKDVRDALRRRVEREFAPAWWRRAIGVFVRPVPAYGALMVALIPVLLWVASTAKHEQPPLEEATHAESTHVETIPPAPARMRNYDASSTPRIYRGVL
jgi:anti-sigma factor RsiW